MPDTDKLADPVPAEQQFAAHLAVMSQRLEEALAAAGFDAAVVFAGSEKTVFRDDKTYPLEIEPYFKAWVPPPHRAGSLLKLVPGERPTLIQEQTEDFWHEPAREPQGPWLEHFDVRVARSDREARMLAATGGARCAVIGDPAGADLPGAALDDEKLLNYLDFFRAYKTPYEVACIASASAVAVRGHRAAAARLAEGVSEFDLHHTYCRATQQREIDLPYPNIVALNEHAAILHYQNLRTAPPPVVRSFLLDAGAEFHGYACDVTRTQSARDDAFAALIASMERLQQTLCAGVRSGVDFVDLDLAAHRLLAEVLAEHALVVCGAEEAFATGITRVFLPHGLGHLLGLQVHDAGGRQIAPDGTQRAPPAERPHLRLTRVLEPGVVLTIEPGIYFIPSLLGTMTPRDASRINWREVDGLSPFGGIRIEDDLLVTAREARNITREAFASARH